MKKLHWLAVAVFVFSLCFAASCETSKGHGKDDGPTACLDSDNDAVCDLSDGCPTDPSKIAAGQCGCGNPDTDGDGDGTANCVDGCPTDIAKIAPGQCGCGNPDTDGDHDGTANCNDSCPADPGKIAPGVCGCGVADNDSDGDGKLNCLDGCPNDKNKIAPGICGCGIADTDTDTDGTADCIDQCDNDPLKIVPGQCGCGNVDDLDGDGLADCEFNLFTPTTAVLPSGLIANLLLPVCTGNGGLYGLAVDSKSNAHIVFNGEIDGRVYASFSYINNINGVWKYRNTWPTTCRLTNRNNSIAIDHNDRVHIATAGYATTPGEDLIYVSNKTGQWVVEVADDDRSVGLSALIKTDSNNKAHIFHLGWQNRPLYSTNKNGSWETSLVEALPGAVGPGWSFALDSLDRPHVFYGYYGLWHAYLDAGTWLIEEVDSSDQECSAANYGNNLYLATWGEIYSGSWSSWTKMYPYSSLDPALNNFRIHFNGLGVDSNGKLHYAFTAGDASSTRYLIYMTNLKGSWQYYILDQETSFYLPQLAIDKNNHVHLLYAHGADYLLRYVTFDPATF